MNMKEQNKIRSRVKKNTIKHYNRMIVWAKKQPKKGVVDHVSMNDSIYENWGPLWCDYCDEYYKIVLDSGCPCPLRVNTKFYSCCNGLHHELCEAKTWGEWIKVAKKVLKYIRKNG